MGTALAMYLSFLFLSSWLSPTIKRRAVGLGLVTDITVHVVLQTMFGGDANGRAGLLLAGIMINLTMHAYRWWYGYETLGWRGWTLHAPARLTNAPTNR
ncbi:MAG TPA: hypothetical protein PKZ27_03125 [Rhodocyclaceae bacterium]|nr:hypothetical protein [Rhodocyclaceae bacterium]